MANKEHLGILKQGVEAWNRWKKENPKIKPDLREANLTEANLSDADLSDADLGDADLGRADLGGAKLHEANLRGADLRGAYLREAISWKANLGGADLRGACLVGADLDGTDLSGANLYEANLSGANLHEADLGGANLSDADLSEASVAWTRLGNIDLSKVKGLDTVTHSGPSSIGIDTIYQSRGQIPKSFLRDAGVPHSFIDYMQSLVGKPFDFYSCFISYSHEDEEFTKRLHSRMRDEGLRVWYAPEDIRAGEKTHHQIDEANKLYDKLLVVLSNNSMESEWVKTEIYKARQREIKEDRRLLFPIRLVDFESIQKWQCFDADAGKDLAREIREYYIPNFNNWKNHDAFEANFRRLLKDLKARNKD